MGHLDLNLSLTTGPTAWISEYNGVLDQLNSRLCPYASTLPVNIGQVDPGTPAFTTNATNPVPGSGQEINPFPLVVTSKATASIAFLGLHKDRGGKQTAPGSSMQNILGRVRIQCWGYANLDHSETPGSPMYALNAFPGGLTTSPTNATRIGTYLSNNKVLIWPAEL